MRFFIHFDNVNAATIFTKGSSKFRLQKYATEMDDLAMNWNFTLETVAIPRSLNVFSDILSKYVDLDDYNIKSWFF